MFEVLVTSSVLILALILLRRLWRGRISPVFQYALWLIVAVRLLFLIPVSGNAFSVMNVAEYVVTKAEKWADGWEDFRMDRAEGDALYEGIAGIWDENQAVLSGEDRQSGGGERPAEGDRHFEGKSLEGIPGEADPEGAEPRGAFGAGPTEFSLTKLAWYIWFAGIGCMAAWMTACNIRFRHRLFRERRFLCRRGRIRVYAAESLDSPCLYGVLRPSVYLNRYSLLSERCREHAIAHELTHYRHGDHIWVLVRGLCTALYWFDPLVWLAAGLCARDCEMACDAGTVRRLGEEQREAYGRTLIEMACGRAGGIRMLHCVTDLSGGKKELKERIAMLAAGKEKKGITAVLAALCAVCLASCTFGGAKEEEKAGRYVEEVVECLEGGRDYMGLVQDGGSVCLVRNNGKDLFSVDGGRTFKPGGEEPPAALGKYYIYQMAAAPDGGRMFRGFAAEAGFYDYVLMKGDGTEIALIEPERNSMESTMMIPYYGGGFFYVVFGRDMMYSVYRVDPSTGEREFLLEWDWGEELRYMAADEKMLYIVKENGIQLYDLQERQMARQDEVLSAMAEEGVQYAMYGNTFILYPYGEGVYILNHEGLYRHELYGEDMVKVIDGRQCGIGLPERDFTGMTVLEGEEEPVILISYTDGTLARYEFDATLSAVPDALRIYSVYEDGNIMQAVNSFRRQFPNIPVNYETGMESGYGVTEDDVLKKLATEIAAGKGPDILVMDNLPVSAYIEKEALMDLSFIRKGMTDETYFTAAADAFSSGDGQYVMPLTFSIPVLAGKREEIEGVETLAQLAGLLEAERAKGAEGPVFTSWDAESTLRLLAQASMGAWVTDAGLEREAVRDFLTQAKRIYDAVMEEPASWVLPHRTDASHWNGAYPLERWFDCVDVEFMMECAVINYPEQQYHAGYLSGAGEDFIQFAGVQEFRGDSCVLMPGQMYGTGLASTLLAVNRSTGREEDCRTFLSYVFSEEFQRGTELNGTPLNRAAYEARKVTEIENRGFSYSLEDNFFFGWPREEDFDNLDEMLGRMTGINFCDYQVYETVVSLGKEALTGERDMEEALDAIEKKVKLYLAE